MRVKFIVEYDGSAYFGWQFQNKQISVQEAVEKALFVIFKKQIRITASGRTDRGVHARGQTVHMDIPEIDLNRLKRSLNGLLAEDIVIKSISRCADDFHARFDAKLRTYRYTISTEPSALNRRFAWFVYYPLNIALMQKGADIIAQYDDFQSFCKTGSNVKNYICMINSSRWLMQDRLLIYEISASRFLHGMVRAITGCLVDLGRGVLSLKDLKEIIEARDRTLIKKSAPPQGLVLEEVTY